MGPPTGRYQLRPSDRARRGVTENTVVVAASVWFIAVVLLTCPSTVLLRPTWQSLGCSQRSLVGATRKKRDRRQRGRGVSGRHRFCFGRRRRVIFEAAGAVVSEDELCLDV